MKGVINILPKSLKFDKQQQAWVGTIRLPLFDRCKVRWEVNAESITPLPAKSVGKSRQGRFELVIEDPSREGPTAAQQAAVEHLQSHEQPLLDAVMRMAFRECRAVYYPESLPPLRGLDGDMRERRALFNTREGFEQLVRLTAVTVLRDEKRRVSYVSFDFFTPLDVEHGISVLFHKTKGIGFAGAGACGGGVPPERSPAEQAGADQLLRSTSEYRDSLRQVVDVATARKSIKKIQTVKQKRDASLAENQRALLTDRKCFNQYTQLAQQCLGELHRICQQVPGAVEILDEVLKRDAAWKETKKSAKKK
jgi:hypothetical protein